MTAVVVLAALGVFVAACALTAWRERDGWPRSVTVPVIRACPVCEEPMPGADPRAVYCSHACRQAAYRQRLERRAA